MPKLARENNYYSQYNSQIYDYRTYANRRDLYYRGLQEAKTPIKQKKKKSPLQIFISMLFLSFVFFCAMPFAFRNVTKAIFVPTPYKNVKVDMYSSAFPTADYISNTWFMGYRGFGYSQEGKDAQMVPLKENVNMPVLKQKLLELATLFPTIKPALYVWDYETGNYVDINADKLYPAASIIKVPVLVDVFRSIEEGQFSLTDKIPITEYYRTEGSGFLQFKGDRAYKIDDLARMMITHSDNSATNMLISKVGSMTDVNQSIRDWGLTGTHLSAWLPDLEGNNKTTAKDMAEILYNIDENEDLLTEESRTKIFSYMGHVKNDRLIKAGLGQGAVFLHKTGDIGTMLGDAGIVIAPNGRKYIVVILANRPHNDVAGKDFIVKASEVIYNYLVK
jgi:beta-lactamase class A